MLRKLFLDFNAYFTSCEQHLRPELRGRPVAVTPVLAGSGCCIAASYEARRYGVKTGMRVDEARRRCPEINIVEARPAEYVRLHHALLEVIDGCMYVEQVCSIDEVCCPLTGAWRQPERARQLAERMRARIRAAFSPALRCSIGLAPNAYLAKVASEIVKPDGLVRIDEDNLPAVLLPLALEALPGIGRHMRRRLARCGIHTMEQLWAQPCGRLRAIWGGLEGERFWLRLRGHEVPLPPTRRATFGHSHVLPPDLREWGKARAVCIRLLQKAAMRLRMAAYHAARLDVSVQTAGARWEEWEAFDPACSTQVFITAFGRAWERRPALPRPVAVAVALSGLTPSAGLARPLFAHDRDARREQLDRAMDALNLQLGARTVYYGGAWGALHSAPTRIAFAQIPDMRL